MGLNRERARALGRIEGEGQGGAEEEKEKKKDGEDAGANEGGDLLSVAVPAEDHAGPLEGFARQNPQKGFRELDQRHPLTRPSRRHLFVCSVVQGKGEAGSQVLRLAVWLDFVCRR